MRINNSWPTYGDDSHSSSVTHITGCGWRLALNLSPYPDFGRRCSFFSFIPRLFGLRVKGPSSAHWINASRSYLPVIDPFGQKPLALPNPPPSLFSKTNRSRWAAAKQYIKQWQEVWLITDCERSESNFLALRFKVLRHAPYRLMRQAVRKLDNRLSTGFHWQMQARMIPSYSLRAGYYFRCWCMLPCSM